MIDAFSDRTGLKNWWCKSHVTRKDYSGCNFLHA